MINLFSSSWKRTVDDIESRGGGGVELSAPPGAAVGASLDSNEGGKSLYDASAVRAVRSLMDADVSAAIKKAKVVKLRLESLDHANAANRSLPGCGPGSSTDRARATVVAGLRKKLRDSMDSFSSLRARITSDYLGTVARRYFTRAIAEQQGRGEVMEFVVEIQEQHGGVAQLERSLLELQQVFNDMAVLVDSQGKQLNNIKVNIERASSFVHRGREQLQVARNHQKSSRKWMCYAIGILVVVVIIIIVVPIVLKRTKNNNSNS
ncbi:hypothetical protein ACQ4PT_007724 [Festuca glaucescens]